MARSIPRIGESMEECLARRRAEWAARRHIISAKRKAERVANRDQLNAERRAYNATRREVVRAQLRESYQRHRAQRCIDSLRNHKKRKLRIPKWSEVEAIKAFYEACPVGYEVDHIIPLLGKTVSGLHVLSNLQYLTRHENRSKKDKF